MALKPRQEYDMRCGMQIKQESSAVKPWLD
jgi:hypothetical protein